MNLRLSSQLILAFALIIGLVLVNQIINYNLNRQVSHIIEANRKAQSILSNSTELQRLILDMQNGFRGYLLTNNERFLMPFNNSIKEVPEFYTRLGKELKDQPEKEERLQQIMELRKEWLVKSSDLLGQMRDTSIEVTPKAIDQYLSETKGLTDRMRLRFLLLNDNERIEIQDLREQLKKQVSRAGIINLLIGIITILFGVAFAFYIVRKITGRINEMLDLAENVAEGKFEAKIHREAKDELSGLAVSLDTMAEKLHNSFNDLQSKNRDLEQFARVVSHDLKAPLRAIGALAEILRQDYNDVLDETGKEYLKTIENRIDRMYGLIEGILIYSRTSNKDKDPFTVVDLNQIVKDVENSIEIPDNFTISIKNKLPLVYYDKTRIYQIFQNLITNAIKFNNRKKGKVIISSKEKNKEFIISISDNGPGIEKKYQDKIFDLFQTLQPRDIFESSGVGLSIVKKSVETAGGKIWLNSELGKGTTFYFSIPHMHRVD